ncbi:MAG: hypothetical protein WAV31_05775 [Candidatus Moraniibacteriota bacterium]
MLNLEITPAMFFVPFWSVFKLFLPYIAIIILARVIYSVWKKENKKRRAKATDRQKN